jgi:iojap-like ribosome-associated protein
MTAKETAIKITNALNSKKAQDIKVLHIEDLTIVTDYFVIANGTSNTQVKALAEEVEFQLEQEGIRPRHIETSETRNWVLLDYNAVIVHIFLPEAREFYDLERLWADGVPVEVELD